MSFKLIKTPSDPPHSQDILKVPCYLYEIEEDYEIKDIINLYLSLNLEKPQREKSYLRFFMSTNVLTWYLRDIKDAKEDNQKELIKCPENHIPIEINLLSSEIAFFCWIKSDKIESGKVEEEDIIKYNDEYKDIQEYEVILMIEGTYIGSFGGQSEFPTTTKERVSFLTNILIQNLLYFPMLEGKKLIKVFEKDVNQRIQVTFYFE